MKLSLCLLATALAFVSLSESAHEVYRVKKPYPNDAYDTAPPVTEAPYSKPTTQLPYRPATETPHPRPYPSPSYRPKPEKPYEKPYEKPNTETPYQPTTTEARYPPNPTTNEPRYPPNPTSYEPTPTKAPEYESPATSSYGTETTTSDYSASTDSYEVRPGSYDEDEHEWGKWSHWTKCSASCGDGVAKRTRTCAKRESHEVYESGPAASGSYDDLYGKVSTPGYAKPPVDYQPEIDEPYKPDVTPYEPQTNPTTQPYEPTTTTSRYEPTTTSKYQPTTTNRYEPTSKKPYRPRPYPSRKRRDVGDYGSNDLDKLFEGHPEQVSHQYGEEILPYGCDGEPVQTKPCRLAACAIDGDWAKWSEWSVCSVTCGDGGLSYRNRSCNNPVPSNGGKLCRGVYTERQLCSVSRECPVDGGWSSWSNWTPCSVSCGHGGTTIRDRSCTHPKPSNGGEPCDGDSKEIRGCCKDNCAIDGNWGAWTAWSNPSITCGVGGVVNRTRCCDNPTPSYGGEPCRGSASDVNTVHLPPCAVHGGWTSWSSWSTCSVTCGTGGFNVRSRVCDHPAPLYGGKFCIGDTLDSKPCSKAPCAIPGGWSNWYGWSACSATCGFGGRVYRKRICDHPRPAYGGAQCEGEDSDSKFCFIRHCPQNGIWSAWSEWAFNSVTCGEGGSKTRTRECTNPEPMYGGSKCLGDSSDTVPVELPDCPINGGWSGWSSWTDSSVTCGDGGISTRKRTCTNPRPSNGGRHCHGADFETRTVDLVPCAVCGGWTAWSDWSDCSKTCGSGGLTSRTRECTNPTPTYGGHSCVGEPAQTKSCFFFPCPTNGAWSGWSEWSLCSATCGDAGFRQRIRHCDNPEPSHLGQGCEGVGTDSKSCTAPACPVDGKWSSWSEWSAPTQTCGYGAMSVRVRTCTAPEPAFGGHYCPELPFDVKNVTTKPCPIDGGWTHWSPWSRCSVTCGKGGSMTRSRECSNPRAQYGGKTCKGDAKEARFCASKPCAVNGNWGPWSDYSTCSVTCGDGGITTRMRVCDHPAPAYGGDYCRGPSSDTIACTENPCASNGGWGQWSPWSEPTVTCGYPNAVRRTRNCDNPTPSHDGEPCEGESSETKQATIVPCPINGAWTTWTGWSICSVTCGTGGVTKRHRYCENPEPLFGGHHCEGEPAEVRSCDSPHCAVDGGWTEWSAWSKCTVSCGEGGWVTRRRECSHPDPQYGGKYCHGSSTETIPGVAPPCPVDGGWGKWNAWSSCSVSCGLGGSTSRSRQCDNPAPAYHGKPCNADSTETKNCSAPACSIDGDWSDWSEWGRCSVTCGEGHQERARACDNPEPRYGGRICTDDSKEKRTCTQDACPVDGGWSSWSEWSDKSVTCGSGAVVARKRRCNNPEPAHNGKYCLGPYIEVKNVTTYPCIDDGGWSRWSPWSACSVTCGYGGFITRTRTCTYPTPSPFGKVCLGDHEEKISCHGRPCPIPGGWTSWCSWSSCSATCGDDGTMSRSRSCENPVPAYGGQDCTGDSIETTHCSARPCSTDGGWSLWSEWAKCSVTCGEKGITTRNRECINPAPDHAGKNCQGVSYESKNCTEPPCPTNGGWSKWGDWSDCSQSCGYGGATTRSRTCTYPEPEHGGSNCKGEASETKYCFKEPCNNWSPWNEWSSCIEKCGVEPYQKRTRRCNLPTHDSYSKHINEWCEGEYVEFRNCTDKSYDYNAPSIPSDVAGCEGNIKTSCCNNWIVVAQRLDASLDFNKSWKKYKTGFGDPSGNFYIGNENLHCLTKEGKYKVRFEGQLKSGEWVHAIYKTISVASEEEDYKLSLVGKSGGVEYVESLTGMKFSTFDRDNDNSVYSNCAKINGGGWWFDSCYKICLTCDYKRHFEIKELGAAGHLLKMRVSIIRAPQEDNAKDTYGAGPPEITGGDQVYGSPSYPSAPEYETPEPYSNPERPEYETPEKPASDYETSKPHYENPPQPYGKPNPVYEKPTTMYEQPTTMYEKPTAVYEKPVPTTEKPRPQYETPKPYAPDAAHEPQPYQPPENPSYVSDKKESNSYKPYTKKSKKQAYKPQAYNPMDEA